MNIYFHIKSNNARRKNILCLYIDSKNEEKQNMGVWCPCGLFEMKFVGWLRSFSGGEECHIVATIYRVKEEYCVCDSKDDNSPNSVNN